jgi:hypothetical protein
MGFMKYHLEGSALSCSSLRGRIPFSVALYALALLRFYPCGRIQPPSPPSVINLIFCSWIARAVRLVISLLSVPPESRVPILICAGGLTL